MTYFEVSLPCVHHQCTQKSISFILHECLKKLFCLLVSSRINAVYSPSFSPLLSIDFFRFFGDGSSVKRPLLEYNETKKTQRSRSASKMPDTWTRREKLCSDLLQMNVWRFFGQKIKLSNTFDCNIAKGKHPKMYTVFENRRKSLI